MKTVSEMKNDRTVWLTQSAALLPLRPPSLAWARGVCDGISIDALAVLTQILIPMMHLSQRFRGNGKLDVTVALHNLLQDRIVLLIKPISRHVQHIGRFEILEPRLAAIRSLAADNGSRRISLLAGAVSVGLEHVHTVTKRPSSGNTLQISHKFVARQSR